MSKQPLSRAERVVLGLVLHDYPQDWSMAQILDYMWDQNFSLGANSVVVPSEAYQDWDARFLAIHLTNILVDITQLIADEFDDMARRAGR